MHKSSGFKVAAAVFAGICMAALAQSAAAEVAEKLGSPATPEGITMTPPQSAGRRSGKIIPGILSDAAGMTLYTYAKDSGEPTCLDACAADYPPLVAPQRALETLEWTVVTRPDGVNQWAYHDQPLYTSIKDEKPGDANGEVEEGLWSVAHYVLPNQNFSAPNGVSIRQSAKALGDVLVNHLGMTLYTMKNGENESCNSTCLMSWKPLIAGELAKPFGEWTISERIDGIRQWAFQGKALYTFVGDERPGDAEGVHFDTRWKPAALREYFVPETVQVRKMSHFAFLTTDDGMTLYARDRYRYAPGSFHADDGSLSNVSTGREIGTAACDGPCPGDWVPFKATSSDVSSGYWSILTRDDGTRQWAYQGYALYTNAADKKPGDMYGRDVFEFKDGSNAMYWRVAIP